MLCAVRCVLCAVHCVLCAVHCVLCAVHWAWHKSELCRTKCKKPKASRGLEAAPVTEQGPSTGLFLGRCKEPW